MRFLYRFLIVGLMISTFYGSDICAVSAQQKLMDLEKTAQSLITELGSLKKCIPAGTCSKAQYARIKTLGKRIAAAVLVLLIVKFSFSRRKKSDPKEAKDFVETWMAHWNISYDPNVSLTANSDYRYLYAAATMPKEQFDQYVQRLSLQEVKPKAAVRRLADTIRGMRWEERRTTAFPKEFFTGAGMGPLQLPSPAGS